MAQTIWSTINPGTTSGTDLASILDNFKEAVVSGLSGTSRPTELDAGGGWIDTTNDPTSWVYKLYTGSVDIEVFTVNLATSKIAFSSSDSSFEIAKISADAVGPLLSLVKRRIATNGQVLSGDLLGEIRLTSRTDTSTNPVVGHIKMFAGENHTASASGSYFTISGTTVGQSAVAEWVRLLDGKMGIGTQAPDTALHVDGTTGIKSSLASDDAVAPKLALQKMRVAGDGSVQTSDGLGDIDARAKDSSANVYIAAAIQATATEGHTASARGSKWSFKTIAAAATTLAERLAITDIIEAVSQLKVNSILFVSQNVATTATISALAADKSVVEFTGSTATTIQGVNAAQDSKTLILHNRSTATVTLSHQNGSASAANRMTLPGSVDYFLYPQSSVELYYCTTDTVWKVKSNFGATMPVASVVMYGGATAPTGWLLCDGTAVSRTTYAALFAILSTTYGVGDGSTTFNLPNTSGVFVRGAGTQAISGRNKTGTRGTTEEDQLQGHYHSTFNGVALVNQGADAGGNAGRSNSGVVQAPIPTVTAPTTDGTNGTPRTGTETRPSNITMSYIIKAFNG